MKLKPGQRLKSAVSEAQIMVIKAPAEETRIQCAGVDMLELSAEGAAAPGPESSIEGVLQIGKRYANQTGTLELLCTKGGAGLLSSDEEVLQPRLSKQLPSSD
jgi:hypothetical protein